MILKCEHVQALGLFFAMTLRAISGDSRSGYDSDEEFAPTRQPLLNRQNNQAGAAAQPGAAAPAPPRPAVRNDAWSARMREKVCSHQNQFLVDPHTYIDSDH